MNLPWQGLLPSALRSANAILCLRRDSAEVLGPLPEERTRSHPASVLSGCFRRPIEDQNVLWARMQAALRRGQSGAPGRLAVAVRFCSNKAAAVGRAQFDTQHRERKSTRLNSSHGYSSYAVFCLKKKKK